MAELFAKLERPAMTDLSAEWPSGVAGEVWPNPLPDVYAGEPVVVTFKAMNGEGALVLKGNREGATWEVRLALSEARDGSGIEKLWARNKIASLEESRVLGVDLDSIDRDVLDVALTHHLLSRLTSLVAVDVTPSRSEGEALASASVPLNLPAGWDFDKVFGETRSVPDRRAGGDIPDALLLKIDVTAAPPSAVRPQDAGLVLPQGSTPAPLMLIAGLVLLLLAAAARLRQRSAEQGR
jgi:Ca-activated chloride channel family protein